MRARITDRFGELHHDREQAQAQLDALQAATPKAADPTLLDELPLAGDILPSLDPALKARLWGTCDERVAASGALGLAPVPSLGGEPGDLGAYGWYNFFIRVGVTAGHLVMGSCDDRRRGRHHAGRAGPVSARALGTSACAGDGVRAGTSGPRRSRAAAMTAPPPKMPAIHQNAVS